MAWTQVSSSGCRLTMKDAAVSLTIPEGALAKSEEVFCAILREERDRPKLHDGQTLLSPILSCGLRNLTPKKPGILRFQHCAALKYNGWAISYHHVHHESGNFTNRPILL